MRMDEFLGYEEYIDRPECVAELHAMRITAKRLRYTLEVFAPIYPGEMKSALQAVRKVQESLGDIHDCDVWTTFIPEFLDQEQTLMVQFYGHSRGYRRLVPGLQCFLEDRQAKREKEYRSFLGYWAKIKDQGVWADVLKTIRIPFFQGEQQPAQNGSTGDAGEKPA
jgi:CHAD domain-containing protein